MLVSDDEEKMKKVLYWITQAREPAPWYQHTELGYNYRMRQCACRNWNWTDGGAEHKS